MIHYIVCHTQLSADPFPYILTNQKFLLAFVVPPTMGADNMYEDICSSAYIYQIPASDLTELCHRQLPNCCKLVGFVL